MKVFARYHPRKHKVPFGRKVGLLWVKERQASDS